MLEVCRYVLYFFTYAFIGYVCEVIYCSIPKKKFVNRGYLYAPICPIYGYGAVIVILCFDWLTKYPWGFVLVAIGGMLLTSLLEYLTSFVMEKIFHMRWWDYSNHKFNIKGRVCLLNSTLFMLLVMILMYGIHPIFKSLYAKIDPVFVYAISAVLLSEMIVDTVFSTIKVVDLKAMLAKSEEIISEKVTKFREKYTLNNFEKSLKSFSSRFPSMKVIKEKTGFVKLKEYLARIKKPKEE